MYNFGLVRSKNVPLSHLFMQNFIEYVAVSTYKKILDY